MDDSTDNFLALVGSYRVHPDDAPAFAEIAVRAVEQTVSKPGCLYFTIAEDVTKPGVFHLSEGWTDRAALDRQMASAEFAEIFEQASRLRILGRQVYIAEARGRTPLFFT